MRLASEERTGIERLAERRRDGGVVAVLPVRADGRAEKVVEHHAVLRGQDRAAAVGVRLVDVGRGAATDEREAVPEEVLGEAAGVPLPRRGAVLRGSGAVLWRAVVRGGGELAVGVVGEGVPLLAFGHGQHLVEIPVAVGLRALLHEAEILSRLATTHFICLVSFSLTSTQCAFLF